MNERTAEKTRRMETNDLLNGDTLAGDALTGNGIKNDDRAELIVKENRVEARSFVGPAVHSRGAASCRAPDALIIP